MTQVIPLVITVVLKKYWLLKLISINNNYDATTLHLIQISTAAEIPHGIGYGTFRSVRWIKNASPIGFDARFVTRSAPMFYLVSKTDLVSNKPIVFKRFSGICKPLMSHFYNKNLITFPFQMEAEICQLQGSIAYCGLTSYVIMRQILL